MSTRVKRIFYLEKINDCYDFEFTVDKLKKK